ncbi:MAG: hypothetical protein EA426_00010 [Spirochaetaceae bacterium]|nr:MAG: hypothetical protein EA426_00010 [Spirochaetaceae bacterium]
MFEFFNPNRTTDIFVSAAEDPAVFCAVGDLSRDIARAGGREAVVKRFLPRDESAYLVVGTLGNAAFERWLEAHGIETTPIAGSWERYVIRSFGDDGRNLVIVGSDPRGTMWGVYHVSEYMLGIDPIYLWSGNEPVPRGDLAVEDVEVVSGEPTFKYRGWFLNDEDILCEWRDDGGTRYIDYPFYSTVIHQDVLMRVVETALRLRQNLMIPASFIDIMNPAEENLVRIVTERGMFVSQHHVEPLGVSHFGWDNYWAARGREIPCSFVKHREEYLEIWREYVERWARYPNVIWQLGLRGRGDRPVWFHDDSVPPTDAARGALISDAYAAQHEIVRDVLGTDEFASTTTLWMEGSELQRDGHLTFPDGVTIVFSDLGSSQVMQEDFDRTERRDDFTYGVYHHVCFWGDGPHLAHGTSVPKLAYNYRRAHEKGDTEYSILNVANVREVLIGAEAVARLTWDVAAFDVDAYLKAWITREFGAGAAEAVRTAYDAYFAAFHPMHQKRIPDEMLLIDGMTRRLGLKLLDMLDGTAETSGLSYYRHLDTFDGPDEFLAYFASALGNAEPRWAAVQRAIYDALPTVAASRLTYFTDHFTVQYETIVGIYRWAKSLVAAAVAQRAGKTPQEVAAAITRAASHLEKALLDRRKAEHGVFENWYRGDRKMNLPGVLARTRELADAVGGAGER